MEENRSSRRPRTVESVDFQVPLASLSSDLEVLPFVVAYQGLVACIVVVAETCEKIRNLLTLGSMNQSEILEAFYLLQ